jgi:dTMP kinase
MITGNKMNSIINVLIKMLKEKKRPITICFEGGEGSGKGTTIGNLAKFLRELGFNVVLTREPGGTNIGEQIRNVIVSEKNTEMCTTTEAYLFAAARAQLLNELVFPKMEDESVDFIILDRYVYSSYVYQGMARDDGNYDMVKKINEIATNGWNPDITLYLDIEPERGLQRIADNNREVNRLDKEAMSFHHKVHNGYLKLVNHYEGTDVCFKRVNADQKPEEVLEDVLSTIVECI